MTSRNVLQAETLLRWISYVNKENVANFHDVTGATLIHLVENLSGNKCPYKYNTEAKSPFAKIALYDTAIAFAMSLNVKDINISGLDLSKEDEKTMLAFINGILNRFIVISKNETRLIHEWLASLLGQPIKSFHDWGSFEMLGKLTKCPDDPIGKLVDIGVPNLVGIDNLGKEELSMNIYLVYIYDKKDIIEKIAL
ncbi:Calponin domain family protein [Entamoeba marina]